MAQEKPKLLKITAKSPRKGKIMTKEEAMEAGWEFSPEDIDRQVTGKKGHFLLIGPLEMVLAQIKMFGELT